MGAGEGLPTRMDDMKSTRRRHDPQFKARVALEALKGLRTIQQIAQEYEVHPVQVSEWKKAMAERAASVFGPGQSRNDEDAFEKERQRLHAKIGQLTIEVEWLEKKSRQLGL